MSFVAAMLLLADVYAAQSAPPPARSFVEQLAAAKAGDREAQFAVGEAFRTGTGTTADRDAAISWYRLAAGQGDNRASAALGVLLFVKGERRTAIPLIQAAASRGDARALYVLGTAHFNGDGVPKDVAQAYVEMRRAADTGMPQAKRSLALMEPYITPGDRARAEMLRTGAVIAPPPRTASLAPVPVPVTRPIAPVAAAPLPGPAAGSSSSIGTMSSSARPSMPATSVAAATALPSVAQASITPAPPRPIPPTVTPRPAAALPASTAVTPPRRPLPPSTVSGNWRVQLGAYGSSARAETQWALLAARLPALKPLDHMVTQAGAMWRLQAGGLASRLAADALCHEVADAGGACFIVGQ